MVPPSQDVLRQDSHCNTARLTDRFEYRERLPCPTCARAQTLGMYPYDNGSETLDGPGIYFFLQIAPQFFFWKETVLALALSYRDCFSLLLWLRSWEQYTRDPNLTAVHWPSPFDPLSLTMCHRFRSGGPSTYQRI